jgi:hypothetical protein
MQSKTTTIKVCELCPLSCEMFSDNNVLLKVMVSSTIVTSVLLEEATRVAAENHFKCL